MGHAHESNTKKIWIVLIILTVITGVEVWLGILKPDSLHLSNFPRNKLVKLDFHYINTRKSILYCMVFYAFRRGENMV